MIKLIIVDDEKTTRTSLKDYIPWSELGIDIVETAKNGINALELAQRIIPDIILTDVRMPKMDGIELATKVREFYPECKIIFLSGYSDKEYLMSAIQLNALNYVEKPINMDEIKTVIQNTVSLCREEFKKKSDVHKLLSTLLESAPLLRQEIALELVKEGADILLLNEKYGHVFSRLRLDGPVTAVSVIINWMPKSDKKTVDTTKRTILQMFCEKSFENSIDIIAGFSGDNILILIITKELNPNSAGSNSLLKSVLQSFEDISKGSFTVSIGVGMPVSSIKSLHDSYEKAVKAQSKYFYRGAGRIFYFTRTVNSNLKIDKKAFTLFGEYLREDNNQAAVRFLNRLEQDIQTNECSDIEHIKNAYLDLMMIFLKAAEDRGLTELPGMDEKSHIWKRIDQTGTLSELSELLLSKVNLMFKCLNEMDATNRRIYEIMRFVQIKYSDKELSIQSIADHIFLSQTYLCAFFKKVTGKTLNEYITEVRTEKAKELLKDSRMKLYEVADSVGFSDTNYFSTVFKKLTGFTPSEFREKYYL